jgi:cell division protein FtsB
MKKYYLMAITLGNKAAMFNLASYYCDCKKYKKMKKYYLMAIDKGDVNAMFYLGYHYYENKKDYTNAKKYAEMGVIYGCEKSGMLLYKIYKAVFQNIMCDSTKIIEDNINTLKRMNNFEKENKRLRTENEKLNNDNEKLKKHIKYMPGGEGMIEAELEFLSKIK